MTQAGLSHPDLIAMVGAKTFELPLGQHLPKLRPSNNKVTYRINLILKGCGGVGVVLGISLFVDYQRISCLRTPVQNFLFIINNHQLSLCH